MPLHLTEYAYERKRSYSDRTFSRFADVFHHRILSLFYRAWANAQPTVSFDRPETDRFNVYVGAVFGLGMPSLWERDAAPDLAKFHYAGRLACQTRNSEGLQAILADFFKLPVTLETFVGHWLRLADTSRCRLGETPATGQLGMTAVIGARVWDCQYKFRIVMGPMGWAVALLDRVWESYKKYSAVQLSAMTHQPGTPWDRVWAASGGDNYSGAIIPNEFIEQHYKEKINAVKGNGTA